MCSACGGAFCHLIVRMRVSCINVECYNSQLCFIPSHLCCYVCLLNIYAIVVAESIIRWSLVFLFKRPSLNILTFIKCLLLLRTFDGILILYYLLEPKFLKLFKIFWLDWEIINSLKDLPLNFSSQTISCTNYCLSIFG